MSTPGVQAWFDLAGLVSRELEQVVARFDEELASDRPFIRGLVEQVRGYRGKLLRPTMLLLAARAVGKITPAHLTLGAVVEMVHMATLVHDDVLDEADLRRRRTTVNRQIGNEGAVLLGDYLISHAYHLCSSLPSTRPSRRVAAVTNTVCEGELMQIENRDNLSLGEADYLEIIRRKTASLTSLCCELGAEHAGASPQTVAHLSAYGMAVGMAFQIVDDLLDLTATEAELGKSVGRDAELGKVTLPIIRYLEQADTAGRRSMLAALRSTHPSRSAEVNRLLAGSGALEEAMDVARSYVQRAIDHLVDLPCDESRDHLALAAERIIDRRH